jgi:hypothetical protein
MRMNLSWVRPFLILVVVLSLPPVIYWFGYVQNSVLEVKREGHATLSAVTSELRDRLAAHDQIATTTERHTRAWHSQFTVEQYLKSILRPRSVVRTPNGSPYHLEVTESGALYVHVADSTCRDKETKPGAKSAKTPAGCVLRAAVPIEDLVPWNVVETEFDGLLVLSGKGALLGQDRRLPSQPLGAAMPFERGGKPAVFEQPADSQSAEQVPAASALTDKLGFRSPFDLRDEYTIQLAGVDYLALLQPVTVMATPITSAPAHSADDTHPIQLLVAALVSKQRLRREAIELAPQTLVVVGSFVLLGLFAIPFLKLRFIGERERMRPRDVWLLSGSILSATAVLTLLVHDTLTLDKLTDRFDAGLGRVATALQLHLAEETRDSLEQLTASFPALLRQQDQSRPQQARALEEAAPCADDSERRFLVPRGSILTQETFHQYPDFEALFITDLCGWQTRKWMTRTIPTPPIMAPESYFSPALTLTPDDGTDYFFSSTVTRTSGLLLGVYLKPYRLDPPALGMQQVPSSERRGVVAIGTPMHSVDSPLIAPPYQFVLVDRQGAVTFQRSQGSFRGERFFEAVRGGSVLERAVRNAEPPRAFQYRGRTYRMQAFDVPDLSMTLVTFYETDVVGALAAGMVITAGGYALSIIVILLLAAAVAEMTFPGKAFDWAWPSPAFKVYYYIGSLACVLSMLLLWGARSTLSPYALAWFIHAAPFVAILALGSGRIAKTVRGVIVAAKHRSRDKARQRRRQEKHALAQSVGAAAVLNRSHAIRPRVPGSLRSAGFAYGTFAVLALLAFVAWPTTVAFYDAYRLHASAYETLSARHWAAGRDKLIYRSSESVVDVPGTLGEPDCSSKADVRCTAPERLYANVENHRRLIEQRKTLALYDVCANLLNDEPHCSITNPPDVPYSFTSWGASRAAGLAKKDFDLSATLGSLAAAQASSMRTPLFDGARFSIWAFAGLGLLIAALCVLVRSIARHVLGIELTDETVLDERTRFAPQDGTRWLLLRPDAARIGKLKAKRYDLRHEPSVRAFESPAAGETLLLTNIESQLDSPEWRSALLRLLRKPHAGCLVLVSEIDPLYYLSQRLREHDEYARSLPESEKQRREAAKQELGTMYRERARWAIALREVVKLREHFPKFPPMKKDCSNALVYDKLKAECGRSPTLIAIGERLLEHPKLYAHRWDEIVGFVLDAAEPYYRSQWELCSREERVVMIQLADCGLINPKRIGLVRRLARRGLVVVDPRFKLMNESFERFVCSVEPREHVVEWERSSVGMSWTKLATPLYALAAIIVAILLFTEQALFSSALVVATGAARTLGSLRGLYASVAKPTDTTKLA